MANRCYKILLLLPAVVITAAGISAQDNPPSQTSQIEVSRQQLDAIEKEINSLRAEAAGLAAEENSLISMLDQYEVQMQVQAHEIELYGLREQKAEQEIADLQMKHSDQQKELDSQKAYLSHRLVEAYKMGRLNYVKLMLQASTASELLRAYQYVTFLAREDQRKLDQYRDSIKETESTWMRLQQEKRNLASLKEDSQNAQIELVRSKNEKIRLLSAIQNQREMHLDALSELKAAANQLQSFFKNQDSSVSSEAVEGISMDHYRGLLEWPVRGRVVQEFGMQKHPKFGTTTMSNGIEISAPEGSDIHAVFAGQVVFAEYFKGYGKSIIVLHPGGYYTMYAHNSDLLVQRGEPVQKGQVIAHAGATGSLIGSGLYFEIRDKQQPVNPYAWLKKY